MIEPRHAPDPASPRASHSICSADEIAELFGVSASGVKQAAARGDLPAAMLFSKYVFHLEAVDAWVRDEVLRQTAERRSQQGRLRALQSRRGQRAKRGASR